MFWRHKKQHDAFEQRGVVRPWTKECRPERGGRWKESSCRELPEGEIVRSTLRESDPALDPVRPDEGRKHVKSCLSGGRQKMKQHAKGRAVERKTKRRRNGVRQRKKGRRTGMSE